MKLRMGIRLTHIMRKTEETPRFILEHFAVNVHRPFPVPARGRQSARSSFL